MATRVLGVLWAALVAAPAVPPKAGSIAVPGTTIHYLDWGGEGPALVFLAGLGNTAHVFETFAPRFRDRFRVVALTRRGFGESGRPAKGYDAATLVADVAAALDSLGIGRVILAGHSMAGDELTGFAVRHPERVTALVYLDAGYDRSGTLARLAVQAAARQLPPVAPGPSASERAGIPSYQRYLERIHGVRWPESEIRATRVFDSAGRFVREASNGGLNLAVVRGEEPPRYEAINAPILALYATDRTIEEEYPWIRELTIGRGAAMNQARRAVNAERAWESRERQRLARANPTAVVIGVKGAAHYIFLSHPDLVERTMRDFLGSVQ